MTKIGLVQAPACYDISVNLQTLHHFAREAQAEFCDVLCFPECFLTGYVPEEAEKQSISLNAEALDRIAEIAQQYNLDILAGFLERRDDGHYITHGLFRRDGSRDFYRKSHLGKKESLYLRAGDRLDVFSLSCGLRIGFQLCVETHYPEITQTLALKGAEVVFAPHAVPRVSGNRQKIWNKYIPARSYDNRIYMACCNLWDKSRFSGGCLVTDPRGEYSAACFTEGSQLLTCEIDRSLLARYRACDHNHSTHFYPTKRRPELYL